MLRGITTETLREPQGRVEDARRARRSLIGEKRLSIYDLRFGGILRGLHAKAQREAEECAYHKEILDSLELTMVRV